MRPMKTLCPVDVAPLLPHLAAVAWRASGVRPWDGSYGMVAWTAFAPSLLTDALLLIRRVLREHLPARYRGVCYLARLVPGQRVPPHVDAEDGGCTTRVHVPLLTNPLATFTEAGVEYRMPAGFAYLIDPTAEHSAFNGGETDRVHLFFNAVAPF